LAAGDLEDLGDLADSFWGAMVSSLRFLNLGEIYFNIRAVTAFVKH
jgi:hypothetical protein